MIKLTQAQLEALRSAILDGRTGAAVQILEINSDEGLSDFEDVAAFHSKFNVECATKPSLMTGELFEFRTKFLIEELEEFINAHRKGDMENAADSLVDLVWVAMGTAHVMGLPWKRLWSEVRRANMAKERATHAGQSKRGSALDVIKPEGWIAPDHEPALGSGPYPFFGPVDKKQEMGELQAQATAWLMGGGINDLNESIPSVAKRFSQQPFCKGLNPVQVIQLFLKTCQDAKHLVQSFHG